MLELKNVCFSYKSHSPVIKNISFAINHGEFLAVIGRNGSGKTTLTRLLMALKKPSAGEILLDGQSTAKYNPADMARTIGYVFQNPDHQIFRDTVAAEVSYGPEQLGFSPQRITELVSHSLEVTGLTKLAGVYPPSLSRSQKQLLAIASALAIKPRLLILDEPTSGQDCRTRAKLMQLLTILNKQGLAILLVTHDMELLAAYVKRVIVMDHGNKVFDGSVTELFANPQDFKNWGLSRPSIINISYALTDYGIFPTPSISEISTKLIQIIGRTAHAKSSTTH